MKARIAFDQLELTYTGRQLKEKGIQKSLDTAERVNPGWADSCYWFFKYWIRYQKRPFKMETFREWAKDLIDAPPSLRSFGAIVRRAKKEGLIKHVGYTQTENPKAHEANCSLWQRV